MRARRTAAGSLVVATLPFLLLLASTRSAPAQLAPLPWDRGASGLALALRRVGSTARVLYVTAHPDDENNGVLVALSRGRGIRTALLTLTRGEGGQNEIGPELFDALGVLRTGELLALHRYDGVEQLFGRAYDFGFSFSVEETFERWGREATLGDVVRAVRSFRPDVMITLPLEAEGGGFHHQASARLAREAFRAAADPARFPEQVRAGLLPWQAWKLYQGATGGGRAKIDGPTPVTVETGVLDPVFGLTWQQVGSLARSMHKCQGMVQLMASPGAAQGSYFLVDSEPRVAGSERDVLDGVDGTIAGLARLAHGEDGKAPFLTGDLASLQSRVEAARAAFAPNDLGAAVPALASALEQLRLVRGRVAESGLGSAARFDLGQRLGEEEHDLLEALALAQELDFQVLSDDDVVVPGQSFNVTASVWNGGSRPVPVDGVTLAVAEGWTATPAGGQPAALPPGQTLTFKYAVKTGENARYSQPYFKRPPGHDRYEIDVPGDEGRPWSPPDVTATLQYTAHGVPATLESPAVWRYEGRVLGGEKQKVVNVAPALSVQVSPPIVVVPVGLKEMVHREFRVSVLNAAPGAGSATVTLEMPPGFSVEPGQVPLEFRYEGEELTARFFVTPPPALPAGEEPVRAVARQGGREYDAGVQVVAYDHVQERRLVEEASARVKAIDVRTTPGTFVGYVTGTGDQVADAIAQLGIPVTFIDAERLAFSDLSRFTTIVTGVRAYRARPDLRSYHNRLMEYVRAGGNLVVQYNRAEFNVVALSPRAGGAADPARSESPFAPYPAAVSSERITDEGAPVKLLAPEHRLFNLPNRIGEADWQGWVQERGLQFLDARDPRYLDLIAMTDPFPKNPGEKKGALVEAKVGKGTWTYVGLSLFRQLPAGTTGAYRLLANLVGRPRGR